MTKRPPAIGVNPSTVLLVEDDALVRSIAAEVLRMDGFRVLEAGDGPEAVRQASDAAVRIDLVVSDLVLPMMSGPEVAEEIRRTRPEMKVIFITGHSEDIVERSRVAALGASILSKPFRIEELTRRVREALAIPVA